MADEAKKAERCSSCGIILEGTVYTSFNCPQCGEMPLARCWNCKNQSIEYECPECGFQGP